jgi:hypothetical protein
MNSRTLDLYRSLRRVIAVVDAYPDLRAYADESNAYSLFVAVVDTFEGLQHEEPATRLELAQLAVRKKLLTDDVNLLIESICATFALMPPGAVPLGKLSPVSPQLPTFMFSMNAVAIIDAAAKYSAAFIGNGLHPRTFDDARDLITRLTELDRDEIQTSLYARTFKARLAGTVVAARLRRRQLYLELHRTMTAESRAAWRIACALGRTHRQKQLSAGISPKLLAAPALDVAPSTDPNRALGHAPDVSPTELAPHPDATPPDNGAAEPAQPDVSPAPEPPPTAHGLKRLARRVGLRLTRTDNV